MKAIQTITIALLSALSASASPKHPTTLYVHNQTASVYILAWTVGRAADSYIAVRDTGWFVFPGETGAIELNSPDPFPDLPWSGDPVTGTGAFGFIGLLDLTPIGGGFLYSLFNREGVNWDYFEKYDSCSVVITDGEVPGTIEVTPIERHNHPHVE